MVRFVRTSSWRPPQANADRGQHACLHRFFASLQSLYQHVACHRERGTSAFPCSSSSRARRPIGQRFETGQPIAHLTHSRRHAHPHFASFDRWVVCCSSASLIGVCTCSCTRCRVKPRACPASASKLARQMLSDAAPRAKVTNCSTVPINTTAAKRSKPFGDLGDEIK